MKPVHKLSFLAAALLFASGAMAFEPFKVADIRVEGIQRTEAGTVFSYLPIKVGEELTQDKASEAIKALYATGFFKDVRLETQDNVLIVLVEERPAIAQVEFTGMKEFSADDIKNSLKQLGVADGRILDRALLDKAEQELKRQYYNRGLYAAEVHARLSPLERNRTAVTFEVSEGEVSKIRAINIVGAQAYAEKELLKQFVLTTPGMMTWYNKNDQYSKQKLSGDLENLRSFYLNRGHLLFNIDSTQVSITPDKKDIYITLNISEGPKFSVSDFRFSGDLPVDEAELKTLVTLKPGDPFSRERLNESVKKLGDRFSNDGYAFANINAAPEIDKEKNLVAFNFLVDPGRRVSVRRINIAGNTKSKDEVIRREMRQMEGATYSAEQINRSRERVERLSFFKDVGIETPPVPDAPDQVDINVNVTEQASGNILLGAGFSSTDGVVLSGSVTQNNLFGTGNRLALQINSGSLNTVYSLSYTNPYYTVDGVSLGYDIYRRDVDYTEIDSVEDYQTSTIGAGIRLGVPLSEYDTVNFGASLEQYSLTLDPAISYGTTLNDFVSEYGDTTQSLRLDIGWARDSRDSFMYPTKGMFRKFTAEWGTPVGDLQYYKLAYQHQWLKPLSNNFTLMLNGEIGYGNGVNGKPMPFFRNFYAGGIGSVRGYDTGTLAPKDSVTGNSVGGSKRIVGNAELLFPFPGAGNDRSLRLSAFLDAGAAFNDFDVDELRYSVGMAVTWYSPMGPIKLSLAKPLRAKEDDELQEFQFQLGTVF
ncbi:MAG: outer membrane protein assembly factor BamA [Hydrogenophilales bacterium]|nr:outer membrane protein assembly factor BamA [Hydrogenophilales bacterium]